MFQSVLVDRAASPSLRARDCGQEVGAKAPFDAHRFATPLRGEYSMRISMRRRVLGGAR